MSAIKAIINTKKSRMSQEEKDLKMEVKAQEREAKKEQAKKDKEVAKEQAKKDKEAAKEQAKKEKDEKKKAAVEQAKKEKDEKKKASKEQTKKEKRPPNNYIVFAKKYRDVVKGEHPEFSFGEISKEVGRRWKEMSAEEKEAIIKN